MDEKELIEKLQKEETKNGAFRSLVKEYKAPMYRFVRKIVIDHQDTDDVLQLTFIKVFKYVKGFKGNSSLKTWMLTIARNEAYAYLKEKAKKQNVSIDELSHTRMAVLQVNSHHYTGTEIQLKLQQAVSLLPEKQRDVFNMKYFDKLKYKEISEITGTSQGGLKANYFLAVNKLKILLEQA